MIIDAHGHMAARDQHGWKEFNRSQLYAMDRLGIDMAAVSVLPADRRCPPDGFIKTNNDCLGYMKEYRGRLLGYCYVNPGYVRDACREVQRCFDAGMIGVKLYHAYFLDDPVLFPLVERTIELGIPILMHAGVSYQPELMRGQPRISGPAQFVGLIRRYPEALLIEGHIGGGGDWENVIEGLKADPRIYADTSGSVVDESLVDTAVRELGIDRLLYANDCSFCDGMGKIMSADLTPAEREKIFSGNFKKVLARRKGGSVL